MKIILRRLMKHRLYTVINAGGLAIGICVMLLAMLYLREEHRYDTFHQNANHIYRVTTVMQEEKGAAAPEQGGTGQVQGPAFGAAIPEIIRFTRVMGGQITGDIMAEGKVLRQRLLFTDSTFLNIFTFPVIHGNPVTALTDIGSAVVTERTALRYFHTTDVVGKLLEAEADPSARALGRPLVITAVIKDPPDNSSFQFDILLPISFLQLSFRDDSWLNPYLGTYVQLRPDAEREAVIHKMTMVFKTHASEQLVQHFNRYGYTPEVKYGLQPFTDIHLHPMLNSLGDTETGISKGSRPLYSWLFLGIAVFILFMAGINFVNISLAMSLRRAKETGIRRIAGSSGWQIAGRFLVESAFICGIALLLALALTWNLLPVFNELTGTHIVLSNTADPVLAGGVAGMLLLIVLLTGIYPAVVVADFRPVEVLYNRQPLAGRNLFGRALVVVQLSLAVFMLIAVFIYYGQMDFIRTKNLGYNPQQVLGTIISGDREVKPVRDFIRNELANNPAVKMVAFGGERAGASPVMISGQTVQAIHRVADEQFIPLMEMQLKAGRNFSTAFPGDKKHAVIVNEAFVKAAGLQHPLGTQLHTDTYFDKEVKTIVGVVKDFHTGSLRENIQPVVMLMSDWFGGVVWVKYEQRRQQEAMVSLQRVYEKSVAHASWQYFFADEQRAAVYFREEQWLRIIRYTALLAVLICASGLFGLAHFSVRQRVREIGIRKVLGASAGKVLLLLLREYFRMILLAFTIAAPLAWIVMHQWLQQFAYRITPGPGAFIAALLITVLTTLVAAGSQSVRAALTNPVRCLQHN
ncbi:FtsX-like permease family protein [Chitinophaga sp. Mgbs1]|uniref:FtsX-like permease family protein n=1 Tax=Chitinophaga solisilvae TaxID=1233460 RepID=A0A433WQ68_9BACT|nr:FtsX-like permease family protein [Chitinophaga solisilvae]